MFDGTKTPQQRVDQIYALLKNAKPIALTSEENEAFETINKTRDFDGLGKLIAKISERTMIPLSSGRVAHDAIRKCLLIVD